MDTRGNLNIMHVNHRFVLESRRLSVILILLCQILHLYTCTSGLTPPPSLKKKVFIFWRQKRFVRSAPTFLLFSSALMRIHDCYQDINCFTFTGNGVIIERVSSINCFGFYAVSGIFQPCISFIQPLLFYFLSLNQQNILNIFVRKKWRGKFIC